jgi:hypothetical protein
LNIRLIRSFLFSYSLPIKTIKERMLFYFFSPISSESRVAISNKSSQNVRCSWWEVCFRRYSESLSPMKNLLTSYRRFIREEGWITYKHLKKNDSYTPPINSFIVSVLAKHFWCNIIRSTDCWISKLSRSFIP